MSKFSDMGNNEIQMEIQAMTQEYENVKQQMLRLNDKMVSIEKLYESANNELIKRLKRNA